MANRIEGGALLAVLAALALSGGVPHEVTMNAPASPLPPAPPLPPWPPLPTTPLDPASPTYALDREARQLAPVIQGRARAPVPGVPGYTMGQLVEAFRARVCPWVPLSVLMGFIAHESSGFSDRTWIAGFYELNLFQVPGGASYHGTRPAAAQYPPPGQGVEHTAWGRICAQLGYDPQAWSAPVAGVHVGLVNLVTDYRTEHGQVPALAGHQGGDWDLRAYLLLPFAIGVTGAKQAIARARLTATVPEGARWDAVQAANSATSSAHWIAHINAKMALAKLLGYRPT